MRPISFWERESFLESYDYLIIGAGIVGLSAALQLKRKYPDAHIAVIERNWLPNGASTKNAGFACFGSPTELLDDLGKSPAAEVFNLVQERYQGLELLKETLGESAIGYEPNGGYEIFTHGQEVLYTSVVTKLTELNQSLKDYLPFSPVYSEVSLEKETFGMRNLVGIIRIEGEAQINTGKMMRALWDTVLSMGVRVFTGVEVDKIEESTNGIELILTDQAVIKGKELFITINGFIQKFLPEIAVYPARAQVMITKPIPGLKLKGSYHYDEGYYYFRNVGNRVLLGGGRNLDFKGEQTTEMDNTPVIMESLHHLMQEVILPGIPYEEDMRWSGIMGVGPVKKYILEQVSPRIRIGVRMGGMGVALGSLVGLKLAEGIDKGNS